MPGQRTRPITDRVKEALFDIVGGDVTASTWWDVYAGTGAVGIEALSRGAAYVRFTEMQGAAVSTKSIDTFLNFGIVHKRRSMLRFSSRIDYKGAAATPVFTIHESTNTV